MIGMTNAKKVNTEYKGLKFTAIENSTIKYDTIGSPEGTDFKYMKNNSGQWLSWTKLSIVSLNANDYIYIKGNNPLGLNKSYSDNADNYNNFIMTGKITISGNINSLLDDGDGSSISSIPNNYCYHHLFSNCIAITNIPELSTMTLTDYCYSYMFYGCTSLTEISILPAVNLAEGCYLGMFAYCENLTKAPELPATTLFKSSYESLFEHCILLEKAPELPNATTYGTDCYKHMFYECSSLNYIKLHSTLAFNLQNIFSNWVYGVSNSGTIYYNGSDTTVGDSAIPTGWLVSTFYSGLKFTAIEDNSTISYTVVGSPNGSDTKYSIDGINWITWNANTSISLNKDDYIYVKGNNPNGLGGSTYVSPQENQYVQMIMTGKIKASGNINSWLDDDDGHTITELPQSRAYCFTKLFLNCSSLISMPDLPANKLATHCYENMFKGCSSLIYITKSIYPTTSLANDCFRNMFEGCSSLIRIPRLVIYSSNTRCCYEMFKGCSSLTTISQPSEYGDNLLNISATGPYSCYGMFEGCSSLMRVPDLPATQIAGYTPATYCYAYMFKDCISLINAPIISAQNLAEGCYHSMFKGCSLLVNVPSLPVTTLYPYCYAYMFEDCTSLLTAPTLPATTLETSCYQGMFEGCSSLNYIKLLYTGSFSETNFSHWVENVSLLGDFYYNGSDTTVGISAIPSGWTIHTFS